MTEKDDTDRHLVDDHKPAEDSMQNNELRSRSFIKYIAILMLIFD